jgi:hypothetical protein
MSSIEKKIYYVFFMVDALVLVRGMLHELLIKTP